MTALMKASLTVFAPALLCVVATRPVLGAVDLSAGASVGARYDSNIYQLASIEPTPIDADGRSHRSDLSRFASANAGMSLGGSGPLRGELGATYSRSFSDRSDELDHGDYRFSAGFDWTPGRVFDFSLDAGLTRQPLGMADVGGTKIILQSDRSVDGSMRVRVTPRWQVGLMPGWSESRIPLPDSPGFKFREKSAGVTLDFLGAGRLVPGVLVSKSWGRNFGIGDATRFEERTIQGTLNYEVSDLSTLSFAAGHSGRSTRLSTAGPSGPVPEGIEGKTSSLTGSLSISRQISVKTSVTASAFRSIEQYQTGVNPSVNTGFAVGASWAPTRRLSVALDSSFTMSSIRGMPDGGNDDIRDDITRAFSLSVGYLAFSRISVRAHMGRYIRRSEVWIDQYHGTIAGVDLTARID